VLQQVSRAYTEATGNAALLRTVITILWTVKLFWLNGDNDLEHLNFGPMKKLFLSLTVLCLAIQFVQAQRFEPHVDLNLGIGVLPTFVKDHGKAKMLPMTLTADYKFTENFSLGLAGSYSITESGLYQFRDGTTAQWRNKFSTITLRAAAHSRLINDCLNIYGGLNVGYTNSAIEMMQGEEKKIKAERGIGRTGSNFLYTAFLGTRYCLGEKVGLFGEVGFGVSIATVGVSVRL
jgi:hypothetical protein